MAEGGLNGQTANRLINLMDSTGYPLRQVNGQRIFGPHPNYCDIVPPKGSEVFVGKLPRDVYEDALVPIFTTAGTIYELRLMMDFNGFNRGYAFVTYLDVFSADRAVKLLDNYEIRLGRNIGVCKSVDNCRLFIGGIPRELTRADIYSEFMKHTHGVKDVIVYTEPGERNKNRGFAFIEYESHRAAAMARRELVPAKINLWNADLKVDWAEPEPVVDPLVMQRYLKESTDSRRITNYLKDVLIKVTVLYARNLPSEFNETDLMSLFSLSGHLRITKVKKIRDFAFVHFQTKFEAQLALTKVNGITIGGCVIEVTWAKPPECSVRRHPRCNVEGYKSYPRHPLNFPSDDSDSPSSSSASAVSFNFDSPILSDSSGASASKFHNQKYSKLFAALCLKKGWGEPICDCVPLPPTPHLPMQYRCKLIVPGMKILGTPFTVIEASSTPEEAQNKASYSMMAKLGLINVDDGKPSNSTLDVLSSGIHNNLVNGLSSLTLNDMDKGQGDCGLFRLSSDDIFIPYDGPSPQLGAMNKTNVAVRNISAITAKHGKLRTDSTPAENNVPRLNVGASLFQNDSLDPSCFLRDLFSQQDF